MRKYNNVIHLSRFVKKNCGTLPFGNGKLLFFSRKERSPLQPCAMYLGAPLNADGGENRQEASQIYRFLDDYAINEHICSNRNK